MINRILTANKTRFYLNRFNNLTNKTILNDNCSLVSIHTKKISVCCYRKHNNYKTSLSLTNNSYKTINFKNIFVNSNSNTTLYSQLR